MGGNGVPGGAHRIGEGHRQDARRRVSADPAPLAPASGGGFPQPRSGEGAYPHLIAARYIVAGAGYTWGLRCAHGLASSSCLATRSRTSSRPYAAANCTPTGSPSSVHSTGTLIAGWPLMLNGGVNGMNWRDRSMASIG